MRGHHLPGAWIALAVTLYGASAVGSPVVLDMMPAYDWYHGCGPTAVGSIFGYWDLMGFEDLFDASGDDLYLTENVQDQISSPEHNAKYDPKPDDANLPVPPMTSIADWFQTSVDPLEAGWSYRNYAADAFEGYAAYRGYAFDAWYEATWNGALTWEDLVTEIDAGRPMMFMVDTTGNGSVDHFVPVLGYDERGGSDRYYGCYTTWSEDETVAWVPFQELGYLHFGGVGFGWFVQPVPEPSSVALLAVGALWLRRRPA